MPDAIVREKDKPFILALIFVAGFFALLFTGIGAAFYNATPVTDYLREVVGGVIGIVGTVVGFYFSKKNGNST